MCDIYRSYNNINKIPTFDLYFKIIYGFESLPKYVNENMLKMERYCYKIAITLFGIIEMLMYC